MDMYPDIDFLIKLEEIYHILDDRLARFTFNNYLNYILLLLYI